MAPNLSFCILFYSCSSVWKLSSMYLPKESFSGYQTMATQIYKTVIFDGEGEREKVTAGPAAKSYERARTATGAHLIFRAFWLITPFCCNQMYMMESLQ